MDNLAHSLVGLAAAKAGLEKLSPGATAVCILSANVPDIDFLAALSGDRWTVLHHHRGFSHSILGTLLLGLAVPGIFYLVGLIATKFRDRSTKLRFRGLLVASLVTAATHPILDWTNSYGVRPLLPWSGRWFYGDIVFVVDPVIWVLLGASTFLLTAHIKPVRIFWILLALLLTALIIYSTTSGRGVDHPIVVTTLWIASLTLIVIANKAGLGRKFRERLAVVSLLFVLAYWGSLSLLHVRAMAQATAEISRIASERQEEVTRLAATPVVVNPLRWRCLAETDGGVYRFDISIGDGGVSELVRYEKPIPAAEIIAAARKDRRAELFFEFARFPVERIVGADCTTQTLVQFADLRYTEPGRTRGSFALEVPVACPDSKENGR
jgi:inner membrane protein